MGSEASSAIYINDAYLNSSRGFLPRKCVYGTRPVSAHALGAIQQVMLGGHRDLSAQIHITNQGL